MPRPTAAIKTLGCKLNQYESEQMRVQLESLGYCMIDYEAGAELCIVNSCTVTSRTDRDTRRLARRAKRLNPGAYVVVAGCYVEVARQDLEAIPEIDLLIGNADKTRLAQLLPCADDAPAMAACYGDAGPIISHFSGHTRAFVKVQEGCNARCAYCIIPEARGPSRSVEPQQVLSQCRALAEVGCPEIVFIGTHLGQYGRDLESNIDLAELLSRACELPVPRVRLSSLEPREISREIVAMIQEGGRALEVGLTPDPSPGGRGAKAKNGQGRVLDGDGELAVFGKLCRHLHIPLQSGCDSVLQRMNRPYDTAFYRELVLRIKDLQPDTGIGADVIVGFPGETDAEFEATRQFIESLPLSYLHVFTYSQRRGTPAAEMPQQVDYEVRKARNHLLRHISEHKREQFAQSMVGKCLEVVLQTPQDNGTVRGISDNYLQVEVAGAAGKSGEVVKVEIEAAKAARLAGRLAE